MMLSSLIDFVMTQSLEMFYVITLWLFADGMHINTFMTSVAV